MINTTKPVQATGGFKARIVCTDVAGTQPILALAMGKSGKEYAIFRYLDGRVHADGRDDPGDLINVPEQTVRYVGVSIHATSVGLYHNPASAWHNNLKLTYEGDKLVAVEIVE